MWSDSQEGPKSKACLELRLAFGREKGQSKYLLIISNEAFLTASSLTMGKVVYLHDMCEVCQKERKNMSDYGSSRLRPFCETMINSEDWAQPKYSKPL